mmetsp:Transcript_44942/g.134167  ORF Transcript_44942/g.134167 Transcript_44942/m.134167 type:complete len:227 (-) Transcript_44942:1171-1851(-)
MYGEACEQQPGPRCACVRPWCRLPHLLCVARAPLTPDRTTAGAAARGEPASSGAEQQLAEPCDRDAACRRYRGDAATCGSCGTCWLATAWTHTGWSCHTTARVSHASLCADNALQDAWERGRCPAKAAKAPCRQCPHTQRPYGASVWQCGKRGRGQPEDQPAEPDVDPRSASYTGARKLQEACRPAQQLNKLRTRRAHADVERHCQQPAHKPFEGGAAQAAATAAR